VKTAVLIYLVPNADGMNQIRPGEKCRGSTSFDETW
jgi:hypothetical protein